MVEMAWRPEAATGCREGFVPADYIAPLRDMRFVLREIADLPALAALPGLESAEPDLVDAVLDEAAKIAEDVIAPLNRVGDRVGSRLENGLVRTPPGFGEAYTAFREGGWNGVPFEADRGGGGLPWAVAMATQEIVTSANMAFALCPLLTQGAVEALSVHGSPEQQAIYLDKLVSGIWTGTMNLTEPNAGSDVGALRSRAAPAGDGTWRINGTKIFITYGEHDLTENIIHLVLARTPGSPPGTKGISLFIVPKFLVRPDGSLGERNDLRCVSLEHKLGIHASPTCVMSFGDHGGATGYLLGRENEGMRCMFTMMNNARLSVGLQGVAIAERAYQKALDYARERKQGRLIGQPASLDVPIVQHPAVRRALMQMRSQIEAMRSLIYFNAAQIDSAKHEPEPEKRAERQALVDLLIPLSKGWCTDLGVEIASIGLQLHGGMGFIEETGAAQYLRDARIAPIYEGTNDIQAIDLVLRKLPMRGGQVVAGLLAQIRADAAALEPFGARLAPLRRGLAVSVASVQQAGDHLRGLVESDPNRATAGALPFLRMLAATVGGWLLARQALAACRALDAGSEDSFYSAKIATANFFADSALGPVPGLLPAVLAAGENLDALDVA
jgi:alkylation response protein AidB-like acyl-CoA dehydrogenase